MLITCALYKAERWAAKRAMSLRSPFAGDTIARSIAAAMKAHGGKKPVSIRPSTLACCGYKRIRR
jgi:hypothetical protein